MSTVAPDHRTAALPPVRALRRADSQRLLPLVALAGVMLIAAYVVMWNGRLTTFYYDDWNFVLDRGPWTLDTLLFPHNEHFSLVPVFVYKVTLELFGMDQYGVFRLITAGVNLVVGGLVFVYARRRIGPWPSVALAACVMLMGAAWYDLLWAFQMGFLLSLAFGLAAFIALDRFDRAGDVAATVLLGLSLASASIGIPFAAAIALELAYRRNPRRLWVAGVPIAGYFVWYLVYGKGSGTALNVNDAPNYILDGLDDSASAVFGAGGVYGTIIVAGLAVLLVRTLIAPARPDARILALVLLPIAFFGLAAAARAGSVPANTGRYLYPGGLFVALIAVELLKGRIPGGRPAFVVTGLLAVAALANTTGFAAGGETLRGAAVQSRSTVTAIELVGPQAPRGLVPDPGSPQIFTGRYFDALERYDGSPAWTADSLGRAPAEARARADEKMWSLLNTISGIAGANPDVGAAGPAPTLFGEASAAAAGACRQAPGGDLSVFVPPSGLLAEGAGGQPVEVRFVRYADGFPEAPFSTGSRMLVRFVPDRSPRPWIAKFTSPGGYRICTAAT